MKNKKGIMIGGALILVIIVGVFAIIKFVIEPARTLTVYQNENGNVCTVNQKCSNLLFRKIKNVSSNATILSALDNNKYILINDKELKLYDVDKDTLESVDLPNTYKRYILEGNADNLGIVYYKETLGNEEGKHHDAGYYNLVNKKNLYEERYTTIKLINGNRLMATDVRNLSFILSEDNEKILYKEVKKATSSSLKVEGKYFELYK